MTDISDTLRPSAALLETGIAMSHAFGDLAVARTQHDRTTLDLLLRLWLAPEHQLRGVELGRQLLKSPSHVSRLIDRAESEGLVERRPDPDDRRAQRVTLTTQGQKAVADFLPHLVDVLNATIYAELDEDEIETLVDLLTRIARSAHDLLDRTSLDQGSPM